jgi:hypothetical protein
MKLELKLQKILEGHSTDEVIPVLAAYLGGLGVWTETPPEIFVQFVSRVIKDTYSLNDAPPMKDRN